MPNNKVPRGFKKLQRSGSKQERRWYKKIVWTCELNENISKYFILKMVYGPWIKVIRANA